MTFDTQQKSEEKQPEIDNRSNDSVEDIRTVLPGLAFFR